MFNNVIDAARHFFRLAPYNRPTPTLSDFDDRDFTTVAVRVASANWADIEASPTIYRTEEGWYLAENGQTYSRRRDAVRGYQRMMAA